MKGRLEHGRAGRFEEVGGRNGQNKEPEEGRSQRKEEENDGGRMVLVEGWIAERFEEEWR